VIGSGVTSRFAHAERRVDGHEKVSGRAQYAADFSRPDMLWAAFVPSTRVHARIVAIDTAAAQAMRGVHAVLTGRETGERYFGKRLADWPVLAIDRVRFEGEYVAAVAAETPQLAAAAAAAIAVTYEDLPAIVDLDDALLPDAPVLHEHPERYFADPPRPAFAHPNIQGHGVFGIGDVEAGFAQAELTFEHTFTTPRYHGGYLEPRAVVVWIAEDVITHVYATCKAPFVLRDQLAQVAGLPKDRFVVHPCYIGGDFGAKGQSIEEFACYFLAAATGRAVKYVRASIDEMRGTSVRHAGKVTVTTGVRRDGRFVAQRVYALYDGGAYAAPKRMPHLLPGAETKVPYAIPHQRHERIAVYTNTIPGAFVRAPGEVQVAFAIESSIDLIARELGIDPLELRLRNAAHDGDLDVEGFPYQDCGAVAVLEALRRESRWDEPLPPGRGRGIALGVKKIGPGTTGIHLDLDASGDVTVVMGAAEQGMGILTVLTRVVASELGLPEERVRVRRGATDDAHVDPGVGASRTTHLSGRAALDACRLLHEAIAPHLGDGGWDAAAAALVRANGGRFRVTGTYAGNERPGEPQYNDFAGYVFTVSVDATTGAYTIDDVVFALDTGTIINPVAHRGQVQGGFVMGLGYARSEELVLDEGRIVNPSFADYKLLTAADVPPLRVVVREANTGPGPFGARAIGEANIAFVGPALANAIDAACGARLTTMPLTAERIYEALTS
jgi:CO/xanthine dehydrogenase Mo-binding subunit